jgi:hypothetical protein
MVSSPGLTEGLARRDEALALLRRYREHLIRRGCRLLLEQLLEHGSATTDCLRSRMSDCGQGWKFLGAVTKVLCGAKLVTSQISDVRHSEIPDNHGRPVRVWRLCDPARVRIWLAENPEIARPASGLLFPECADA